MTREELLNSAEYWQEMAENECWREGIECKIHLTDNQWHNVKDELPPKNENYKDLNVSVVVWVSDGVKMNNAIYDFDKKSWKMIWYYTAIDVKYWHPLPELPKMED